MSKAQKGSSIATTTNVAYSTVKLEQRDDHEYEVIDDVVDVSGGTNLDGSNEIRSSHRLVPTIPLITVPPTGGNVGVAREEVVYATIPGDQ